MNSLIITPRSVEGFREIQSQVFYTPKDLQGYKVKGYIQGDKVAKLKGLSLDHFDSIQVVRESTNPNKGGYYLHCIGYRKKEKQHSILILEK